MVTLTKEGMKFNWRPKVFNGGKSRKDIGVVQLIISKRREENMKKISILMMVVMFALLASVVMADENEESKAGRLFLFQKCDASLIGNQNYPNYDSFGCPPIGNGPWPIFPGNERWGKLDYSLWGDTFKFSFSGRGLQPSTNYTLIYYPDPWPGNSLICLGSSQSTPLKGKGKGKLGNHGNGKGESKSGNIAIHGDKETGSLPTINDANYNPAGPPSGSGAVGAKIWLVKSEDVQCDNASKMLNWNPAEYLFEYNLIVFEHRAAVSDDEDEDDDDEDD